MTRKKRNGVSRSCAIGGVPTGNYITVVAKLGTIVDTCRLARPLGAASHLHLCTLLVVGGLSVRMPAAMQNTGTNHELMANPRPRGELTSGHASLTSHLTVLLRARRRN